MQIHTTTSVNSMGHISHGAVDVLVTDLETARFGEWDGTLEELKQQVCQLAEAIELPLVCERLEFLSGNDMDLDSGIGSKREWVGDMRQWLTSQLRSAQALPDKPLPVKVDDVQLDHEAGEWVFATPPRKHGNTWRMVKEVGPALRQYLGHEGRRYNTSTKRWHVPAQHTAVLEALFSNWEQGKELSAVVLGTEAPDHQKQCAVKLWDRTIKPSGAERLCSRKAWKGSKWCKQHYQQREKRRQSLAAMRRARDEKP